MHHVRTAPIENQLATVNAKDTKRGLLSIEGKKQLKRNGKLETEKNFYEARNAHGETKERERRNDGNKPDH